MDSIGMRKYQVKFLFLLRELRLGKPFGMKPHCNAVFVHVQKGPLYLSAVHWVTNETRPKTQSRKR